jgi:hypothetical protein
MKRLLFTAFLGLIFVFGNTAFAAASVKPKISMAKARRIALKRAAGKIQSAELEREKGRLVYSFDIRTAKGAIREVWVDADTGRILSVKTETKREERLERENEKRKN